MNKQQQLISDIKNEIIKKEEKKVTKLYGEPIYKYENIDKYLDKLHNPNNKIHLAQWSNNFEYIPNLIKELTLDEYELTKYNKLYKINNELNQTINFNILDKKYEFLDDIIDYIVTDIDIQDQITNLSLSRLKLFELLYTRLKQTTTYVNPYIDQILYKIAQVSFSASPKNLGDIYEELLTNIESLIEENIKLNDNQLDTILYLLVTPIKYNNINTLEDITNFDKIDEKELIRINRTINQSLEKKDIEKIKDILLVRLYGINFKTAKQICSNYDISEIKITEENKDLFEMYKAIYQIVSEQDINILYDLFISIKEFPNRDYRRITIFENELRKAFAKDLHSQIYRIDNNSYKITEEVPIYEVPNDFKMIITALGSFQNKFDNKENYFEYWNSPTIKYHGNCCSLISNSNLSMAIVKNIILGFSTMDDNMLLLCDISDMNSTPLSQEFDIINKKDKQTYTSANKMIDNTRSNFNELVYERRDITSNPKYYKKNPDYIVFIEEYENIDEEMRKSLLDLNKLEYLYSQKEEQQTKFKESLKAAKNFNIPIVKINREKLAKSEISKLENLYEEFVRTKNPILLNKIINKFESNRVGNSNDHYIIMEKYFSSEYIDNMLDNIKKVIEEEPNKTNLYNSLKLAIREEEEKVRKCHHARTYNQTMGLNVRKHMSDINGKLNYNALEERGRNK